MLSYKPIIDSLFFKDSQNIESEEPAQQPEYDVRIKLALLGLHKYIKSYENSILHLEKDLFYLSYNLFEERMTIIDIFEGVVKQHREINIKSLHEMSESNDSNQINKLNFFVAYGVDTLEGKKIYYADQTKRPVVAVIRTLASHFIGESIKPELFVKKES